MSYKAYRNFFPQKASGGKKATHLNKIAIHLKPVRVFFQ